jgi:hypothetical protein
MILCVGANDKIQVVTSAAVTVDVHASGMDVDASGNVTTYRKNTAISTATTTDITAVPASGTTRNVKTINLRNKAASSSVDVTVQHTDGTTTVELYKTTLLSGQTLEYAEGVGWAVAGSNVQTFLENTSTAAQGPGLATDTYLTNSNITIPSAPVVGSTYLCKFDVTKTAAGTAAPVINLRIGAAGTTSDTSRATITYGVGTAVADTAIVEVRAFFRAVGAGTSAVLVVHSRANCLPSTGWSSTIKAVDVVSSGFDSTTIVGQIIGLSYNGGTSASHTIQLVRAEWYS